jgi:hypothetical protein
MHDSYFILIGYLRVLYDFFFFSLINLVIYLVLRKSMGYIGLIHGVKKKIAYYRWINVTLHALLLLFFSFFLINPKSDVVNQHAKSDHVFNVKMFINPVRLFFLSLILDQDLFFSRIADTGSRSINFFADR